LLQGERSTWRTLPLLAPALYVLFRPEQEHGSSSKDHILIPVTCWNADVDHPGFFNQLPAPYMQGHTQIAATATRANFSVSIEHRGDAESVPNAISPIRALLNLDWEAGGNN
jgi:hypothetical protein